MLENIPSQSTMIELLGQSLFEVWQALCSAIDEKYDMERLWNTGGKNWTYECKYRRGGKTLCCLYAKSNCIGFMIIFGKDERAKFEDIRDTLSDVVCRQYDEAKTYHDGKWVMFEPTNADEFDDYMKSNLSCNDWCQIKLAKTMLSLNLGNGFINGFDDLIGANLSRYRLMIALAKECDNRDLLMYMLIKKLGN